MLARDRVDHDHLRATLEDLRARIARVPRVRLGEFPTPLTECPRLQQWLDGPRIFVKREDLSGVALGGNKSRLLEFRLAEALAQRANVVVAGLEVQSNSARQLTAAANRLGLRTHLVLRPEGEPVWQGNLLLDHILGAQISFLDSREADLDRALVAVAGQEEARGFKPYIMNQARFFGIGAALAGLEWTVEAIEQLDAQGLSPTHFYLSSGGKCQAGMVIAQRVVPRPFRVVGLNANPRSPEARTTAARIANETLRVLDLAGAVAPADVENSLAFAGEGFGMPTEDGLRAIERVARSEGILLDPVFSGKAMAGLLADIERGVIRNEDLVVFVHTGGIPGIFTHAHAFMPGANRFTQVPTA